MIQDVAAAAAPATPRTGVAPYIAAAVTGLLLAAAFPPLDWAWLAWIALVPLLWSLRHANLRTSFRLGYVAGIVWFAVLLSWLLLFGPLTWLLVIGILALYTGTFAVLYSWLGRRFAAAAPFLAPLLWTALEVIRSNGPLGFPWGVLGVTQYRVLPVLQVASIGGVHLVSLLAVLASSLVVALLNGELSPRRRVAIVTSGVAVLAASLTFGWLRLQVPLQPDVRAAALQPNVPPLLKSASDLEEAQVSLLRRLTVEAEAAGARLIVFPESAVPLNLLGSGGVSEYVSGWAPRAVIVATSFEVASDVPPFDRAAGRRMGFLNTAVVLHGGKILGAYAKRRLVPFGEAATTPGVWKEPVSSPVGRLGMAVCYESAFAPITRSAARQGAGVLAILTNDGYFATTGGAAQHAAYARLRAVENGRTVIRAANTGTSMIVDPLGRMTAALQLGAPGVLVAPTFRAIDTIYIKGGWLLDWFLTALAAGVVLAGGFDIVKSRLADRQFARLLTALVLPGAIAFLWPPDRGLAPIPQWLAAIALVLAALAASRGRVAFIPRRAPVSAGLGLVVVMALGAAMVTSYARYGVQLPLGFPAGGWLGIALLLVRGVAWEAWLRGAVYTTAREWKGDIAAIVASTGPVLVVLWTARVEVLLWFLITGVVFGAIRRQTGDALGLGIATAAGISLLEALSDLRLAP